MRRLVLTLAGSLAALGLPALAQQAIPDTVVTATRIPTPQERVPASVTVITRRDIEERGYQSVAEALTAVPGLNLVAQGGLGGQTSLFARGANSGQTLVLLDGVPLNDVSTPAGAFNFGQDLLAAVERIEVIRGPASSLYGSQAIGATINLVTRQAPAGKQIAPFGEFAGGSQNTLRGTLGAAGRIQAFDYLFSGSSLSTRQFNTIAPRLATSTGERDGFTGRSALARLGWTPAEGSRLEGTLQWRQNRFGLDGTNDDFRLADDPNYSAEDRRWYGQIRGETRLLDGRWTTGLRVFATDDRRRYVNLPNAGSSDTADDLYVGRRTGIDWGNTLRLPDFGAFTDGALAFGVTHALEESRTRSLAGFAPTRFDASQHTTAGRAALQYRLLERLDLTAAIRQDNTTGFTDATTWRLGAVLAVPELASRLHVAGGTGFRAPSLYERFVTNSFTIGNPDLRPERSIGWEIGAETDWRLFGTPRFATTSWTFFQSRINNLVSSVQAPLPGFVFTSVNLDRADIHGAELGLTLRPARWLETTANWTITEAVDAATDRRLLRRPEHVVSVTARVVPLAGVVIAPTVSFNGRASDFLVENSGDFGNRGVTRAGTIVNLAASWQVRPPVALFLEARNLGNSRWEPTSGYVTPGRSVILGTRFAL